MSETVFLVLGECGEYSDHRYWHVAAYVDREQAELHAKRAKEEADRIKAADLDSWESPKNPYDSRMELSYTGADYGVIEVPVRDLAPEAGLNVIEEPTPAPDDDDFPF